MREKTSMAELDRAAVLTLLNRLGDPSDETVLQAARDLSGKLNEAGMTWDDLLRPDADDSVDDAEPDASFDEAALAESGTGGVSAEDRADVGRLVERLMRLNLSETMRADLVEFQRTIADGSIDAMDCKYIRALARRLGA
jgi:hypothetical protein